jgi:hypothetical protein
MKKLNITGILFILLFLDVFRPAGFFLNVEFILLGIICIALYCPLNFSFIAAIAFGLLRDCLSGTFLLSSLEFPALVFFIGYLKDVFAPRYAKFIIVTTALCAHAIVNNLFIAGSVLSFLSLFFLLFFLHSLFFFFVVERIAFSPGNAA